MKHTYPIRLFFDPRGKAWVAVSDDLPGCSAGGDTPFEALEEFEIVLEIWLDALKAEGKYSTPERVELHYAGV